MHRREFVGRRLCHMNVQRLRLIDESSTISCHFEDYSLRYLPYGFVQHFQIIGYAFNILPTCVFLELHLN